MQKPHTVIELGVPSGDIVMATVENRYRGKLPGVPDTPCLLIVQAVDPEGYTWMTRVVGIDRSAIAQLDKEAIPFIATDARIEARLHEYFELSWQQLQQAIQHIRDSQPIPALIQ